jgi:hypothetical protein
VEKLGNKFDCVCNPEIMAALVYALNDCDERVRKEAADELGDQLRKNPCCCSDATTQALIAALGDCDKGVRRQVEEALRACGYEVKDCCEQTACCTPAAPACAAPVACGSGAEPAPAPAPTEAAPAPAPAPAPKAAIPAPAEPEAYFPSRIKSQQTKKTNRLSNLFGLRG